ncbi:hypothetical protein B0H66DRAFT_90059 [Apodospora peruviana]|uniref:Histone-lysine N-methyltransferase n=1 Tax=Apodospora peruviana TaxID=516989 RepID=A0AAE0IU18_9PEZI|nr:hypothetical protein B0H66DRAFT_90059 [Apodospora peruviana]
MAIMATMATMATMAELGALSTESSFSAAPTDASSSSNAVSLTSTPPTTVSPDSISLASEPDIPKLDTATTVPLLESAIPLLQIEQHVEVEQPESGQQTPVASAIVVADEPAPVTPEPTARPRRARSSLPVYNISQLSGTSKNRNRRAKGDDRRRTISGDTLLNHGDDNNSAAASTDTLLAKAKDTVQKVTDALNSDWSIAGPSIPKGVKITNKYKAARPPAEITRRATRHSGIVPETTLASSLSALGKRSRKTFEKGLSKGSKVAREILRLQDTNEFAKIDTRPVLTTYWSNGKFVDPNAKEEPAAAASSPPRKKARIEEAVVPGQDKKDGAAEPDKKEPAGPPVKKRRVKKWLEKGLYAGQEAPADINKGLTAQEKKKLASIPELAAGSKPNKTLPLPIFNGMRILINGRDFKLPYDICNPLPPGQPKPAAYRTMTRNRFVGDAAAYWKKTPHFEDFASKCVCKPEDGCAEDCQNRIMLYECDETNCNVGKERCQNRAFQNLQERVKKGGRYRVGVEVVKTSDRGYGVRSNRCFEPNQIIMEYTGEIITEEECERRMNEEYKNNECYYLMSFDQNMIIDATTGSIARFVNHSCSPNCRMIKWIVSGQPRMALFAGDRPIMTGEELTYDYNFDPFSAKNVQKCLCGSANCRGVLGPKPKDKKPPKPLKEDKKSSAVKGSVKAGKRKLKELLSAGSTDRVVDVYDEIDAAGSPKKMRKIKTATGVLKKKMAVTKETKKKPVSSGGLKAAKSAARGAATAIKRSVSNISVNAKSALGSSTKNRRASTTDLLKTYSSGKAKTSPKVKAKAVPTKKVKVSSRSSSLTIVAAGTGAGLGTAAKRTPKRTPKKAAVASASSSASAARKRTPSWKVRAVVADSNTPATGGNSSSSSSTGATKKPASKARSALELSRPANKIRLVTNKED